MTAPRQVLPGTTYLVTRRCFQRQHFLRPSRESTQVFQFLLAVAARRFGIRLHAFCVLSNHYHLVLTDPGARLPAFGQYLDSLLARTLNALLARWESFWAPSSYSAVALTDPEDILDKIAYTLANPVAAGLVRCGREWPGARSAPDRIGGGSVRIARPRRFFRPTGPLPADAELELAVPPGFETPEAFRALLLGAVAHREEQAVRDAEAAGRDFLGVTRVLAQSPLARPPGREPRRRLNPRVAARDRWRRLEVLRRLRAFVERYRAALGAYRSGALDTAFPAGTYRLRVALGVRCESYG